MCMERNQFMLKGTFLFLILLLGSCLLQFLILPLMASSRHLNLIINFSYVFSITAQRLSSLFQYICNILFDIGCARSTSSGNISLHASNFLERRVCIDLIPYNECYSLIQFNVTINVSGLSSISSILYKQSCYFQVGNTPITGGTPISKEPCTGNCLHTAIAPAGLL